MLSFDALCVVAARLWLNVLVVRIVVLEECFEIWLLLGYGDVFEPPLLFKDSQPHVRRFVGGEEDGGCFNSLVLIFW